MNSTSGLQTQLYQFEGLRGAEKKDDSLTLSTEMVSTTSPEAMPGHLHFSYNKTSQIWK